MFSTNLVETTQVESKKENVKNGYTGDGWTTDKRWERGLLKLTTQVDIYTKIKEFRTKAIPLFRLTK